MKTKLYNINNEVIGEVEVNDSIFNIDWNPDLVHQAIVTVNANDRIPWAHTKTRGEVRGGGKKPWAQKGTGRARHGSTRSPLWTGGGVVFGPRNSRDYSKKINKKMAKIATYSLLSKKIHDGEVKVVEGFLATDHKTKNIANILAKFQAKSFTIIASKSDKNMRIASKNIPKVSCLAPDNLNIKEISKRHTIIISKDALESIK